MLSSTIGLGACREAGDEDPEVIALAIRLGCNVVDTAPHYHGGAHERAVGDGIRLAKRDRNTLFISTKVGRVPELVENNRRTLGFGKLKAYVEQQFIARGLFAWDDLACSVHTFAPAYVRYSIEHSLDRLRLDRVDCAFLDAPELQLGIASRSRFASRIRAAFETLESLCDARRVGCYGIATAIALDLEQLVELAREIAGARHRLRAVQVPLSLLQQGLLEAGTIARAADLGLHVVARGCLDGGSPGYRIPSALADLVGDVPDATAAIRWTRSVRGVGTVLFGSRDARHVRANIAAATLPLLGAA
jgi:aryl-alcohol dehydrogenase-like predicted oxidoreductase